ncbi:MAG: chaperone protein DnaK, partial [Evtepia sp.]|nr:chaperone protein DnaK [Evtepia sp.]
NLETEINKVKEALKADNTEAIKLATEELTKAFYTVSEKLYQQGAPHEADAASNMGGSATDAAGDANVVDADYTVVDDEKK